MAKQKMPDKRLAVLDIHSPLYLKTASSRFCGGDIGDLYPLIDKAAKAGFGAIQFTPLQDTGRNHCPYMGLSIFSLNPVHLSLELLDEKVNLELIDKHILTKSCSTKIDSVSYRNLYQLKVQALRQIFDKSYRLEPINIKEHNRDELAYATYKALKHRLKSHWFNWPRNYKSGDVAEIVEKNPSLHREIQFYLFVQATLKKQWLDLKKYAAQKNVSLLLDKPIYPVHDSADVWANQELFYLRKDGSLKYGSGCENPRDPFGAQYWGHAVYKFKEKPKEVIDYFVKSVAFMADYAKFVRLDHALALVWKYYVADPKTKQGKHIPAIKHKLFDKIIQNFPQITFIAEDLGFASKKNVDLPLLSHNIPGMRCPQWFYIPKYSKIARYPEECMAITSNHDMDSLPAWWRRLRKSRREIFFKQLNEVPAEKFEDQVWQIIDLVFQSQAKIAGITLRDLSFDLRRYNKPGSKYSTNWASREHINLDRLNFAKISKMISESNR